MSVDVLIIFSRALFYWLWPPVFQGVLDDFVEFWNTHRFQKQNQKDLPSGATLASIFHNLSNFGSQHLSIPIEQTVINRLYSDIAVSKDDAYKFVEEEFANIVTQVWERMGSPVCNTQTAWRVFESLIVAEEIQAYEV